MKWSHVFIPVAAALFLLLQASCTSGSRDLEDCGADPDLRAPNRGAAYWPAALPRGSCENDGDHCAIQIYNGCGNDLMQCTCDGQWQCAVLNAAATSCK